MAGISANTKSCSSTVPGNANDEIAGFCKEHLSSILEQAGQLLDGSIIGILARYEHYPYCIMKYHENGETADAIELRLDNDQMRVVCNFNNQKKCTSVFIHPDNMCPVGKCRAFLYERFDYDYTSDRWILPTGRLAMEIEKEKEIYFVLYR